MKLKENHKKLLKDVSKGFINQEINKSGVVEIDLSKYGDN